MRKALQDLEFRGEIIREIVEPDHLAVDVGIGRGSLRGFRLELLFQPRDERRERCEAAQPVVQECKVIPVFEKHRSTLPRHRFLQAVEDLAALPEILPPVRFVDGKGAERRVEPADHPCFVFIEDDGGIGCGAELVPVPGGPGKPAGLVEQVRVQHRRVDPHVQMSRLVRHELPGQSAEPEIVVDPDFAVR